MHGHLWPSREFKNPHKSPWSIFNVWSGCTVSLCCHQQSFLLCVCCVVYLYYKRLTLKDDLEGFVAASELYVHMFDTQSAVWLMWTEGCRIHNIDYHMVTWLLTEKCVCGWGGGALTELRHLLLWPSLPWSTSLACLLDIPSSYNSATSPC